MRRPSTSVKPMLNFVLEFCYAIILPKSNPWSTDCEGCLIFVNSEPWGTVQEDTVMVRHEVHHEKTDL